MLDIKSSRNRVVFVHIIFIEEVYNVLTIAGSNSTQFQLKLLTYLNYVLSLFVILKLRHRVLSTKVRFDL